MIENQAEGARFGNVQPGQPLSFTGTLISYDNTTGLVGVQLHFGTFGSVQVRASPLIRTVATALLVPGMIVVVEQHPGRLPYVTHIFDAEGAPPTGAVTTANTGNPYGAAEGAYIIPSSNIKE